MNVDEARVAEEAAQEALRRAEAARDLEISRARNEISERHEPAIRAARGALFDARRARVEAEDATAGHPWEGKRVWRMEGTGRWSQRQERVEAIVETYRSGSTVPANFGRWRLPPIGTAIVRPLKKDGSPAAKFSKLDDQWNPWTLVEEGGAA